MTYSQAAELYSSKKTTLIKLVPSKLLVTSDVTEISPNIWKYENFFENISSVLIDKIEYTLVTGTPDIQQYSYNQSTGELLIYSDQSPDYVSFIINFELYFTNGDSVEYYSDPYNKTGNIVEWQPRVSTTPILTESIEDIENGFLSIGISNFSILNHDAYFQKYLDSKISFMNKPLIAYHFIDDINNIKNYFFAILQNVSLTSNYEVNFDVRDYLQKLEKEALLDSYMEPQTSFNPYMQNVQPTKANDYYKFFFGRDTKYRSYVEQITGFGAMYQIDPLSLEEATWYNYNPILSTTVNRNLVLGIIDAPGLEHTQHSVLSFTQFYGNAYLRLKLNDAKAEYFSVGDQVNLTMTPAYAFPLTVVATDYINQYVYVTSPPTVTTVSHIQAKQIAVAYFVRDNITSILEENNHYTVNEINTPNGNRLVGIILKNNLEADLSLADPIDPEIDTIYFKIKPPHNKQMHGTVVKKLVEKTGEYGFVVADETTANTDLVTNVTLSVPFSTSNALPSFREVLEFITKSALSYIYINDEFKVGYKILKQPVGTIEITEDEIIQGSFSVDFDYFDIKTKIIFNNDYTDNIGLDNYSNGVLENTIYKDLHDVDSPVFTLNHVIDNLQVRGLDHVNLKINRKMVIGFSTNVKLFDSKIGDDIVLTRSNLPGGASSLNLKIISIVKSKELITVKCSDFLGL